jgi:hypothetical protein
MDLIAGRFLWVQALGEESWDGVFCGVKGMLIEGMTVEPAGGARKRVAVRAGNAGES